MLTDNQNKIIRDLTNEFLKMNKPTSSNSGGGLINKSLIDKKFAEASNREKELKCITQATFDAVYEIMDRDIERLNKDLVPMGMRAFRNELYVKLFEMTLDNKPSSYLMYFNYTLNEKYEKLADDSTVYYKDSFRSIRWQDYQFNDIDMLCQDKRFISSIEDKYKYVLNKTK
jgi:hypothetical protein